MKMTRSEAGKLGAIKSIPFNKKRFEQFVINYNLKPKLCKHCLKQIPYG